MGSVSPHNIREHHRFLQVNQQEHEMDRAAEILWAIKRKPEDYLPEKSIWDLKHFLSAYYTRLLNEGLASELNSVFKRFEVWLGHHFEILVQSNSVYEIADSYSNGPEDALRNFYALFEQFQVDSAIPRIVSGAETESLSTKLRSPKVDLAELLREIRKRPHLYIGYPHLAGVHAYLTGHQRAGSDLRLPQTRDEGVYEDFKRWVERDRFPRGRPRPWFKLIRFHSAHDCGSTRGSAYSVFFELLDQFAEKMGSPALFQTPIDVSERPKSPIQGESG